MSEERESASWGRRLAIAPILGYQRISRLFPRRCRFEPTCSSYAAQAIVRYAEGNHASLIVMGAATHGLQMQRFVATVPIKVAMDAPCTVILVKQALPFDQLADLPEETA